MFRDVGVGVINGSLWTLTTEILFYACVPVIVWAERRLRFTVAFLLVFSFAIYAIGPLWLSARIYRDKTIYNLVALSPIVWGWMFAVGILAAKNFTYLKRWISYAPLMIAPVVAIILFGEGLLFGSSGNMLGVIYFFCYASLIIWLAFALPLPRIKFDLSYGAYAWHMPIINLLLVLSIPSAWLAISLTVVLATLSWFFVEKPSLRLKSASLKLTK